MFVSTVRLRLEQFSNIREVGTHVMTKQEAGQWTLRPQGAPEISSSVGTGPKPKAKEAKSREKRTESHP